MNDRSERAGVRPFTYVPTQEPWHVRYEDERLLFVEKPAELLTVPGKAPEDHDCLLHRVRAVYPEILLVHRLDLATSGLVVFARDRDAQGQLGRAFQHRQTVKRYEAMLHGRLTADTGTVDQPVRVDWPRRPIQIVDRSIGKPARTDWRVLEHGIGRTRVSLVPHTGRTHQLRVHMQWLGHPMFGDRLYGPPGSVDKHRRLHLHAAALVLPHPTTGLPVRVESAVPF